MTTDRNPDTIDIGDAQTDFSRVIERVERGEEVMISRAGIPVAKVVPLAPTARRTARGSLAGRIVLSGAWDSAETNEVVTRDFRLAT